MAGMLSRLFSRAEPETRAGGGLTFSGGFPITAGGSSVTPGSAEGLSTVVACVNAIATGIATLPATVYRAEGDGRVEAPNHPVSRLLRAPNTWQTWPGFCEWLISQALLWGNGLAVIETDGAGRPTALRPIPWQHVNVSMLPSGRLAFDVVTWTNPWGGTGESRRFLDTECLLLSDRSDDGVLGRSRISRAPEVLRGAIGLQTFASAIWDNAACPSGLVTVSPSVKPDGIRRMDAHFNDRYVGAANAKRVMFADIDTKFTPMAVSPEDAEVLESRRFSVIEICRLFGVPPSLVQDLSSSTFTNSEQASIWFSQNALAPWCRKIEAAFARSVFADPNGAYHLEIDLSGLQRGSYETRWTANVAAVAAGILTADEIRAQEGFAPLPKAAPAPVVAPVPVAPPVAADPE